MRTNHANLIEDSAATGAGAGAPICSAVSQRLVNLLTGFSCGLLTESFRLSVEVRDYSQRYLLEIQLKLELKLKLSHKFAPLRWAEMVQRKI